MTGSGYIGHVATKRRPAVRKPAKRRIASATPTSVQLADFATWLETLLPYVTQDGPARNALIVWMAHRKYAALEIGNTEDAETESLMRSLYELTKPIKASAEELEQQELAIKAICNLSDVLNNTIEAMKATTLEIIPKDGIARFDLSLLLKHLQKTAYEVDSAVRMFTRKNLQDATAVTHSVLLLNELHACGVLLREAVELCRVVLKCHGLRDHELHNLSRDYDSKTIRYHRDETMSRWLDDLIDGMEKQIDYLESIRDKKK